MGCKFTFHIFNIKIFGFEIFNIPLTSGIAALTISTFYASFVTYFKGIITAAYIFIIEHRHIEHIPIIKKIWYCLTFPIFDIIGKLSLLIALFKKVEWKEIPHTSNVNISDINAKNSKSKEKVYTKE